VPCGQKYTPTDCFSAILPTGLTASSHYELLVPFNLYKQKDIYNATLPPSIAPS